MYYISEEINRDCMFFNNNIKNKFYFSVNVKKG